MSASWIFAAIISAGRLGRGARKRDGHRAALRAVMLNAIAISLSRARLRRIEIWVAETKSTIAFVTNNFKLAAATIADIYRDRWQIELLFKALKQSLRIKTFIGTSENAVQTQIWTALIAMLL